jgi:hypothetical protein
MMQMLAAGGLPVLTDGLRAADDDNQHGYFEWEPVKQLPKNPSLIAQAEGKTVKVISSLLAALEPGHEYRVIFMIRPVDEIVKSQAIMIQRRQTQGAALSASQIAATLGAHREQVLRWLETQRHLPTLPVEHRNLLGSATTESERIANFLGMPLDTAAMAQCVDPALWRQRSGSMTA